MPKRSSWRAAQLDTLRSHPTEGDRVTGEERLLTGTAHMRHVVQGPGGRLYILTDEADGRVLRLDPA